MTTDLIIEESDMNEQFNNLDQQCTDIDCYRKLVKNLLDLRRYKSALYWSEKVAVLSQNYPKDVYQMAQCMYMLKEYNRAGHVIKRSELEKKNLLCLTLLIECLYASKEYQEALNLLDSLDIEDLNTSLHEETDIDPVINQINDNTKNDLLASLYLLKAKILEAVDKRSLAIDCYIHALQKSVYMTEALDALVHHEILMSWEEKDLIQNIMPTKQCNDADLHILKYLYEQKLKKYYSSTSTSPQMGHPEKTPNNAQLLNAINEKIKASETVENRKSISTSTAVKGSIKLFSTPSTQTIMSPANKILYDLKNTSASSFSIQSSLSRSMLNCSRTVNTNNKIPSRTAKNSGDIITAKNALRILENSVDILIANAEELFYNCEYKKCLKIIEEILDRDPYHKRTLFVQIGCLMELKDSNALYYMAHKLVDFNPDEPISWYAVGSYYILINKPEQGRRYLTKAVLLDRLFGPAFLTYGHSFAKEKEHDQAMAAYFKAIQLMRGCHLPFLYIGVECGLTKNYEMAEKFFYQAMSLAPLDVFVLHELGVIKYESELYEDAEEIFRTTLSMVTEMCKQKNESLSDRWEPLLNNLGHCCRKNKKLTESLDFHMRALSLKPLNSQTYTSIGFVLALMGRLSEAVENFHKSLALKRDDVITSTILKTVLEDLVEDMVEIEGGDEKENQQQQKHDITANLTSSGETIDYIDVYRQLKFDEREDSADMNLECD
ncbi:hypothetical protein PVAND_002896 [Polypedilum vanderplanki]|uniref:Cell division cycle protein 16-like protein n=1 Tax=Polypedilum vanderplanki TaxID=319348 RepID=A0A9J6BSG3_POLVA|nr:hypothetical protein PVAND_002896 [Polypedilum vanderplanki]